MSFAAGADVETISFPASVSDYTAGQIVSEEGQPGVPGAAIVQ
jgi:hypothetical protein